jgi:hypothetical protein
MKQKSRKMKLIPGPVFGAKPWFFLKDSTSTIQQRCGFHMDIIGQIKLYIFYSIYVTFL